MRRTQRGATLLVLEQLVSFRLPARGGVDCAVVSLPSGDSLLSLSSLPSRRTLLHLSQSSPHRRSSCVESAGSGPSFGLAATSYPHVHPSLLSACVSSSSSSFPHHLLSRMPVSQEQQEVLSSPRLFPFWLPIMMIPMITMRSALLSFRTKGNFTSFFRLFE